MADKTASVPPASAAQPTAAGAIDSLGTAAMPSLGPASPASLDPPPIPALPGPPQHLRTTAAGGADTRGTAAMTSLSPAGLGAPPDLPADAKLPILPTLSGDGAPAYAPPAIPPARYQLGHEIARGGMGRVVDAIDTRLGRSVAFKEALTMDRDALGRFEREIRITAKLEHPSIVPVHDAGESSTGAPFYVMRKVSGRPLERMVAAAETLGERLALLPHIVDAAQAIAHAHERHIVHRDIKPSNILIGDLGETVVIDWGLAKVIGEADEHDATSARPLVDLDDALKTRAGIVYGTPGFMAPEQLRGAPVDERCDVYALGATLYHLLARTPPHHAKTADEMMKAAVTAPPAPIRDLVAGVPRDLSTIVDKALAHDARQRYQNARALAEDLHQFLTGQLVASHHYSPREKIVRWVRKNRSVTAAVAALVLVGTAAVIRIVIERDRAHAAQLVAEAHAEDLILTQARYNVDLNPTKAITMVKPLAGKHWREVRAIAAAAHAAGVAWHLPAARHTLSLEMSRDGLRALSAGSDGAARIYDLAQRTSRTVLDLGAPIRARFADGDRQIAAWHDARLTALDLQTGQRRELTAPRPIEDLGIVGTIAYWVDRDHALWRTDLAAAAAPQQIAIEEPIQSVVPSPDGRWIALGGEHHLFLLDLGATADPLIQITLGAPHALAWSADGEYLGALINDQALAVATTPSPRIIDRQTVGQRDAVAYRSGRLLVLGPTGVVILVRADFGGDTGIRKAISGVPAGLAEARGGTMIAGASDGIAVLSEDGDRVLPLPAGRVERVVASPRSPYLLAQLDGRLLLWNLDDIQPRRLSDQQTGRARFVDADRVVASGTLDLPAQLIDATTGARQALGPWRDIRTAASSGPGSGTSSGTGRPLAIVDGDHHLHLVVPGHAPEALPGDVDLAGFATADQLVLATSDGKVMVHDVARGQRSLLIERRAPLLGLAWGRGHHAWVAAAFGDGTLWRKNLATGATQTAARFPPLDPAHPAARDSKILIGPDGDVLYLHDHEIRAWRADGELAPFATAAKPLEDLGEAGADHVVAIASDTTTYSVARPGGPLVESLASIEASSAAMAPDSGVLVAIERGAIEILDPVVHQRWTLAWPNGVTFQDPAISADGHRVVASTGQSLLAWTIELPASADATARWLDAMTNAVDDPSPGSLGWR